MRILYFFADLFINTFGITQPSLKQRRKAAFFILGLVCLAIAAAAAAFYAGRASMK